VVNCEQVNTDDSYKFSEDGSGEAKTGAMAGLFCRTRVFVVFKLQYLRVDCYNTRQTTGDYCVGPSSCRHVEFLRQPPQLPLPPAARTFQFLEWWACFMSLIVTVKPGNTNWRGRIRTVDLLVLTCLDQLLLILSTFITKQGTLMRRSTVLSFSLQLVFPG